MCRTKSPVLAIGRNRRRNGLPDGKRIHNPGASPLAAPSAFKPHQVTRRPCSDFAARTVYLPYTQHQTTETIAN
jgi:hypothetical protein